MPTRDAAPTMMSEVVVAAWGDSPAAYTRMGTARIEPPPPSAPSEIPIRNPRGETSRARPFT
jgi:hypothetical protein